MFQGQMMCMGGLYLDIGLRSGPERGLDQTGAGTPVPVELHFNVHSCDWREGDERCVSNPMIPAPLPPLSRPFLPRITPPRGPNSGPGAALSGIPGFAPGGGPGGVPGCISRSLGRHSIGSGSTRVTENTGCSSHHQRGSPSSSSFHTASSPQFRDLANELRHMEEKMAQVRELFSSLVPEIQRLRRLLADSLDVENGSDRRHRDDGEEEEHQ
ncbi:hypothetical protein N7493_011109 [Penicillium malachiteum]|uniref:Uncharacterized protein n=1 Tax=Penicillium malachiteum TaxID=1324776 RepID=A0AAD6MQV0_9EURO|nr:hypothetical protein N7493_011109 [Penicillium malachiteum]